MIPVLTWTGIQQGTREPTLTPVLASENSALKSHHDPKISYQSAIQFISSLVEIA